MMRCVVYGLILMVLTACSDLQVIKNAALRELAADGYATDRPYHQAKR